MTVTEVAHRLVDLCRKDECIEAQKELYHKDIVSMEPKETGGDITEGLDGIFKKNKKWASMAEEVHGWEVSDPLIADGYFCTTMMNDVTLKGMGRIQSTELCVYEVKDAKIVAEQFFHN